MKRRAFPLVLLLPVAVLVGSCVGSDSPLGVRGPVDLDIPVSAQLIPGPADGDALPINRIRAWAMRAADSTVAGATTVDVSPSAASWEVTLSATVNGDGEDVYVYVLLLHVEGAVETIEFSGVVGPVSVAPGVLTRAPSVPILRGPLANADVTAVTIVNMPEAIREGETITGTTDVETTSPDPPTVFWTSLDTTVLTVVDDRITGRAPGQADLVASAGRFADTVAIEVSPAPAAVLLSPTSATIAVGETVTFTAAVVDVRGDTLAEGITWSSDTPAVLGSLGGGDFTGVAAGTASARATVVSAPTVVGTAGVTVGAGQGMDLQVGAAATTTTPAPGDTVQTTITVDNLDIPGTVEATGVVVALASSLELGVAGATPSQGTYDIATDLWTVGAIPTEGSATLTLDLVFPDSAAGRSVVGTAWIDALDQAQLSLANDTASVTFDVTIPPVDIAVLKTVSEPQPLGGDPIVFTVSIVNQGEGPATDVVVFDTLASAWFTNPVHTLSAGSLSPGDSLWTVPTLAAGDTATWETAVVVAPDVGGSTASNTAVLRSVTPTDTDAANDSAVVRMTFPLSGVPEVTITAPADGAVFDPGELATFAATAIDPEEGDLGAEIEWRSDVDGALATGATFQTDQLSTGLHLITAFATDLDGGTGADTITVTVALISTPATLNVPFGGDASLPITLSEPAEAGGLTLDVTSSDPSVTEPATATVLIPGGSQSANATLPGLTPGVATVTVSNPRFGASATTVSVTAELDIARTSFSMSSVLTEEIDIRFESQGVAIAAPAGGLPVTLTSRDPGCVTAPSVTIPEGQIIQTAEVSYGGSTALSCTAYLVASSPGVTSDSVLVTVVAPPTISTFERTVASGLQQSGTFTLPLTTHGGVDVTIRSTDPQLYLVSASATTEGADSAVISVPDGVTSRTYWVQALEGVTGAADVTVDALGFSQGSATITVVRPALSVSGLGASTTTLSATDDFYAFIGYPSGNGVASQVVRPGGVPVTVTFSASDTLVGFLVDSAGGRGDTLTAVIPVGDDNTPTLVATGGVGHEPVGVGVDTVRATAPGVDSTTTSTRTVTVSAPVLTPFARTVGSGLQVGTSFSLGAPAPAGLEVVIRSSNPAVMQVSPDASTPGADSILIAVPTGRTSQNYYVQGVEGVVDATVATVTVSAPRYVDGEAAITVVQPGLTVGGLGATTTTLSASDDFYAFIGIPSGTGVASQAVRAGGVPVTVTFATDNTEAGLITSTAEPAGAAAVTAVIPIEDDNSPTTVATGGVAFDPNDAAVDTTVAFVTAVADGVISTVDATRQVTVVPPGISTFPRTVGSGLQNSATFTLAAPAPTARTAVVRSSDPQTVLVSPNSSTPGADSILVSLSQGVSSVGYFVQGLEGVVGSATVTVSVPGYLDGSTTMVVEQPAVAVFGLGATTTTLSADDDFYAQVGIPSGNGVSQQSVRAGGVPIPVTFSTDDLGVGVLTDGTVSGDTVVVSVPVGQNNTPTTVATGGVAHDPVGVGQDTIRATAPGLISTPFAQRTVTVSAPGITVFSRTVGSGLTTSASFTLGAPAPGPMDVVVRSSVPELLQVAPDFTTAGADSIVIPVTAGTTGVTYYVQGVEGAVGSPLVTVTAPGYTNGTASMSVVQPALTIAGLNTTTTAAAADDDFYAFIGIPSGNSVSGQFIRPGGVAVTVTFTTSDVEGGLLVTGAVPAGASSVDVVIPIGDDNSPVTVGGGGVAFDPNDALTVQTSTQISVSAPGVTTSPQGTRTVTINP